MTKDLDKIQDWRSTGRRHARKTLFESYEPFVCETCKRTSIEPPKDAPDWFDEIWPEDGDILPDGSKCRGRVVKRLEAQHKTKNVQDNTEELLAWMCSSCHKLEDLTTAVGESVISETKYF